MLRDLSPSRDLDAAIHRRFIGVPLSLPSGHYDGGKPVPPYSSSVDACAALCTKLLPGWVWQVSEYSYKSDVCLYPDFSDPVHGTSLRAQWPDAVSPVLYGPGLALTGSPETGSALTLLCCMLNALEGIETGHPPRHDEMPISALLTSGVVEMPVAALQ
jgi:hypothetical protein